MKVFVRALAVLSGLMVLAPVNSYDGDGVFRDVGADASIQRFHLDLGAVDLAKPWRHEYLLGDLPEVEFVIGLRVPYSSKPRLIGQPLRALVRVTLLNAQSEKVFEISKHLSDWIWSDSPGLTYLHASVVGTGQYYGVSPVVTGFKRTNVGPSKGWGTHFTPRNGERFRLVFETVTPDESAADLAVRLSGTGGGIKQ